MDFDELSFIDWQWESYTRLRMDPEKKKKQVSLLYGTELYESHDDSGLEYTFVPTKRMQEREKNILALYHELHTEDNEIEICNEVFFTTKIEGADTTIARTQAIHDGAAIDPNNSFSEYMVLGCFQATKYMNLMSNQLNKDILLKCWNILVDKACSNTDIRGEEYRTGAVQVANHAGLHHLLLEDAMNCWLEYYHSGHLKEHPFIKAALLHFAFEFIHPFCDGNGRCGRLLMNNFLIANGFEKIKAVSFSRTIDKNRSMYDAALAMGDNVQADCTAFIEYMLDVFEESLFDVLEREQIKRNADYEKF